MNLIKGHFLQFKSTGVREVDNFLEVLTEADLNSCKSTHWGGQHDQIDNKSFKDLLQATAEEIVPLMVNETEASCGLSLSAFLEAPSLVFEPTGSARVDQLLATLSSAESNSLVTQYWATELAEWTTDCHPKSNLTYVDVIQREANLLAAAILLSEDASEAPEPEAGDRLAEQMADAHVTANKGTDLITYALSRGDTLDFKPKTEYAIEAAEKLESAARQLRSAAAIDDYLRKSDTRNN